MKTTQTGKNLTRLNITLPTDLWEWLKSQGKKGNVSASYYLARLVEREKIISEINNDNVDFIFKDLSDFYDNVDEQVFTDYVHTTQKAREMIATEIFNQLINLNFVD